MNISNAGECYVCLSSSMPLVQHNAVIALDVIAE